MLTSRLSQKKTHEKKKVRGAVGRGRRVTGARKETSLEAHAAPDRRRCRQLEAMDGHGEVTPGRSASQPDN